MERDSLLRKTLAVSVFYSLGGAIMFFFPGSVGKLVGLPQPVHFAYSGFCAAVILIFAGFYFWMARQPQIDKPLIAAAAIGKASFFLVMFTSWMLGESGGVVVLLGAVDLVMAAIFARWLLTGNSVAGRQGVTTNPPSRYSGVEK